MKFILLFLSLVLSVYCNRPIDSIKHIIIIIQENWSFDGLFGLLEGVDGVKPENYVKQVTKHDVPYETLMRPTMDDGKTIDERFPATLPNEWVNLTQYVPNTNKTRDLVHRFYTHQRQLNGGKLNKFYAYTDAALLTTSYVGSYADLPFQKLASQYTICNRYFQGHFGGSFLSHFWIVANAAPEWPSPEVKPYPPGFLSIISENGELISDAQLTVDGKYAVNTIFSENTPYPPYSKPAQRLPPQTMTNIGDLLTEKEVDWRYYSGGWDKVMANPNVTDPLFQYHHQPFAYFAKYGDNTEARKKHLVDEKDFYSDLDNQKVPPVSWIKFYGLENEHPGYSDLVTGNTHLANVVKKIQESDIWKDTVIIVTHDEFGGRFDHVPPPVVDEFGPGTRVATIVISPFAKKEYIDNTSFYTHDSLNKFIGVRFGITPHNKRVENASFFDNAFDWNLTGKCCEEGFQLKANATCNYQGACQDCCEKIPEGYGLGILIGVILFVIGGAVVFFLFVTFVIGCKSDKSKDLNYMQVDNPLHQSVQF